MRKSNDQLKTRVTQEMVLADLIMEQLGILREV
jgi:hypothetical protein